MEKVKFKRELDDVWTVSGRTWYSSRLVNEVIRICKRTKEAYNDGYAKSSLADDILNLLDFKNSREGK